MSENRSFFKDTVERILTDTLDKTDIDAAEERRLPAGLYDALIENGITLMLVSEEQGGIGASVADAAVILRAAGAAAAPGPLLETMLGQALLAQAGLDPADGLLSLAFVDGLALPGEGETAWTDAILYDVVWPEAVGHVLIVARTDDGARLIVTSASDWTVAPGTDAAGEPRDTLTAASIAVMSKRLHDYDALLRTAAILRAAQMLGAIDWSFRRSVEYTSERKQFGREIGKFQAIQQMLAELADHVLASAGITDAAAEGLNATLIAAARSRLADAADATITIAHQVHGAIGFSLEYALNARTRRLMAWRDDFGSVPYWRRTLAQGFAGLSREAFWPAVSDAGLPTAA
ncbi:acyl-CoA dehydrogenase family protein [Sphingobium sp.]|uniref:acyl-CoA dehydrogenase family protein n=1 Tax=Sphingobium sp. TaxID=1912891 RepID=UPI002C688BA0|nr:acyl-CoA dehydrogenase family protein [Sphingobium sp.]HUD93996.1 acyl-CoA dehydrogenase family protein [Sphingobium sp.]